MFLVIHIFRMYIHVCVYIDICVHMCIYVCVYKVYIYNIYIYILYTHSSIYYMPTYTESIKMTKDGIRRGDYRRRYSANIYKLKWIVFDRKQSLCMHGR